MLSSAIYTKRTCKIKKNAKKHEIICKCAQKIVPLRAFYGGIFSALKNTNREKHTYRHSEYLLQLNTIYNHEKRIQSFFQCESPLLQGVAYRCDMHFDVCRCNASFRAGIFHRATLHAIRLAHQRSVWCFV